VKESIARLLGLDVFTRSRATTLRVIISLVVKTILPIVATSTLLLAWRDGGGWRAMWFAGTALLVVGWLRVTITEIEAASPDRIMALRRSLLAIREYVQKRTDALEEGLRSEPEEAVAAALDGKSMLSMVMAAIFYVVSEGNSDLNKHIRITFMEPDSENEKLYITLYRNSDMQMPKSMAQGLHLNKGAGVAGKAWELGETKAVANIDEDARSETPVFTPLTRPHEQHRIKSIVCLPVFHRSAAGERLLGVLNIDSDQPNQFSLSDGSVDDLEILLRPYMRLIEYAFVAEDQRIALGLTRPGHGGASRSLAPVPVMDDSARSPRRK
jgi:GAF domain-containing protein